MVPDAFCRGRGIHIRFEGRRYFQEKIVSNLRIGGIQWGRITNLRTRWTSSGKTWGTRRKNMSEAIDPVSVIYKLRRSMQERMDDLVQSLAAGGVDSMEEYKYILGKIHATDNINQELSNLLEPKEPNNDDDKVTRIRK